MLRLELIGYWRSAEEPDWPDPGAFTDRTWLPEARARVLRYLDAGAVLCVAAGASWCRFRCRDYGRGGLGNADLTDGRFVWPSGLAHYVAHHDLRLPEDFVLATEDDPPNFALDSSTAREDFAIDFEWWRDQRGFGSCATTFSAPAPTGKLKALTAGLKPRARVLGLLRRSPLGSSSSLPELRAAVLAGGRVSLVGGVTEAEVDPLRSELSTAGIATEFEPDDEDV
jgi:hypothetical protein